MDILNYLGYFHDGSIIAIEHSDRNIMIAIETSEIPLEEVENKMDVSDKNTIKGIFHFDGVKSVVVDKAPYHQPLLMLGDVGNIIRFELTENRIHLFIEWINFPPNPPIEEYSEIIIECQETSWENIPDLFDPFDEVK